jgi:hypothetical protein
METYHGSVYKVVVERVGLDDKRLGVSSRDDAGHRQDEEDGLNNKDIPTPVKPVGKLVPAGRVHGDPYVVAAVIPYTTNRVPMDSSSSRSSRGVVLLQYHKYPEEVGSTPVFIHPTRPNPRCVWFPPAMCRVENGGACRRAYSRQLTRGG